MKLLSLAQSRPQSRAENAAVVLGFSILMGLLAQVSAPLPFTPVPVTGQTLGVLLAGVLLGGPRAAAAMGQAQVSATAACSIWGRGR